MSVSMFRQRRARTKAAIALKRLLQERGWLRFLIRALPDPEGSQYQLCLTTAAATAGLMSLILFAIFVANLVAVLRAALVR